MLDHFGHVFRSIRITRSLSLNDMAKTLHIPSSELARIERGDIPIPDSLIPALEKHYGIGADCAKLLQGLAKNRGDLYLAAKDRKNSEGYSDPTVYAAMRNIHREEDRFNKLRRAILNIVEVAGFELKGPIILIDKKTGKAWR